MVALCLSLCNYGATFFSGESTGFLLWLLKTMQRLIKLREHATVLSGKDVEDEPCCRVSTEVMCTTGKGIALLDMRSREHTRWLSSQALSAKQKQKAAGGLCNHAAHKSEDFRRRGNRFRRVVEDVKIAQVELWRCD